MPITDTSTYIVKKIDSPLQISGSGSATAWNKAVPLQDFSYPWRTDVPSFTQFKALWDENHFYFFFAVEDHQLLAKIETNDKLEVAASDRVELFFKKDDAMRPYYCLELDYLGRILDYKADYYRKMDYPWEWEEGLEVKAQTTETGYLVEGRISLASLTQLGLLKDHQLQAGLFRAEYFKNDQDQGVKWISWIDPETEKPDFHVPSAFGILQLVDE